MNPMLIELSTWKIQSMKYAKEPPANTHLLLSSLKVKSQHNFVGNMAMTFQHLKTLSNTLAGKMHNSIYSNLKRVILV